MPALGLEVPKVAIDELFNSWDNDGGGSLGYNELRKILAGKAQPKKGIKLSGTGPISQQLAEALKTNATRVLDLFRSWDANGDGEVSRAEFHKAVPALGIEVPREEIDLLFNQWDKGGDGSLEYKELRRILNATPSPAASKLNGTTRVVKAVNEMRKITTLVSKAT